MMESHWDSRGWRETFETVARKGALPITLLKQGVNGIEGSPRFATKFTILVHEMGFGQSLVTSAATGSLFCFIIMAAALPRRLRSFDAHDPDYVGVGRGVCG